VRDPDNNSIRFTVPRATGAPADGV
jgi:hypothetical protein